MPSTRPNRSQLVLDGDGMFNQPADRDSHEAMKYMLAHKLGNRWDVYDASWPSAADLGAAGDLGDFISALAAGAWEVNSYHNRSNPANELVVWDGSSDGAAGVDAASAAASMQSYLTSQMQIGFTTDVNTGVRTPFGWTITLIAVLPRGDNGLWAPDESTFRTTFNSLMQAWCAGNDVRFVNPTLNASHFTDGHYLTAAGKQLVADQVYALIK